jgi:glycosyltransferase involved in cell wall biosynthesis
MQPKRMLCLFDYNSFTGFSSVSKNLVSQWRKTFGDSLKLDIIAINYFGEDYNQDENIRVISAKKKDIKEDDFGRHVFLATILRDDYDAIFILQDLGVIIPIIPHLKDLKAKKAAENKKSFKSFFYFPVDFALNPVLVKNLEFFDGLYTYTQYGKDMVSALRPDLKTRLQVVPHGNNHEDYYKLDADEAKAFRESYFGENAYKFIVGNVNRNQSRKDIPNTIFGFMEFWNSNPNSFLYLHMNPIDPMGWDLRTILRQTPLVEGKDYCFPSEEDYNKGADVKKMNGIYNSLDAFLTTTTGEGWGLTITEAMACGVPVVAPAHTSVLEIADKGRRAYMLESLYPCVAMVDNTIRFQTDIYEIAEVLMQISDKSEVGIKITQEKVSNAINYVKLLSWDWIAKRFSDDFKRIVKIENP